MPFIHLKEIKVTTPKEKAELPNTASTKYQLMVLQAIQEFDLALLKEPDNQKIYTLSIEISYPRSVLDAVEMAYGVAGWCYVRSYTSEDIRNEPGLSFLILHNPLYNLTHQNN